MKLSKTQSRSYHSHTLRNRLEIESSEYCHCIGCCKSYPASLVGDFIKDGNGETALCPYCGTDAVIGDGCGLELNQDIMSALNKIWF